MKNLEGLMGDLHWADSIASRTISENPKRKNYRCAAGITPSGVVHIGNFRDIITSDFVVRSLVERGKKAELLFIWDDYDRLRKVPEGVPSSYSKYLGMPISKVPDPFGNEKSYADHFKKEFEKVLPELGIRPTFINQTEEYEKNRYYEGIKIAMQKRKEIAKILAKYKTQGMSDAEVESNYPLQPYCTSCHKDTTTITSYDGEDIVEYSCACGHSEKADISKRNIGKLKWKVDWAMRWKYLDIAFEPGGTDHSTEGGSYTVAREISEKVFGSKPPIFQGYEFVGIKGIAKMSSSAGTGISPRNLLEIYEPGILRWLFSRTRPKAAITLHFDKEIIRQYDEFDRLVSNHYAGKLSGEDERVLFFARPNQKVDFLRNRASFRQVAAFGQIAQGDPKKLSEFLGRIGVNYTPEELSERLKKTQRWVTEYVPEMKINVRDSPNESFYKGLPPNEQNQIVRFKEGLSRYNDLESLEKFVYNIPKRPGMEEDEKKKAQRNFFSNVYQLLADNDTGPRLPSFILALGKKKVKRLLNFD